MKPHELADQLEKKKNHIGGYYVAKSYVLEKLDQNTIPYRRINQLTREKLVRDYVIKILRFAV